LHHDPKAAATDANCGDELIAEDQAAVVEAANRNTAQEAYSTGVRKTNLIWERTQSMIALAVIVTTCLGIGILGSVRFWHPEMKDAPTFPPEWWTIVGLVIGFYFGRTNHSRMDSNGQR
jgi:hypothetical protein